MGTDRIIIEPTNKTTWQKLKRVFFYVLKNGFPKNDGLYLQGTRNERRARFRELNKKYNVKKVKK